MRFILLVLLLIGVFGGCNLGGSPPVATTKGPDGKESKVAHCLYLDNETGFSRCETAEVVCYMSKAYGQCWPKAAPAPVPAAKAVKKK